MLETIALELPPLIPRATLFGNPEMDIPRISTDGTMLAYLAPYDEIQSLWVRTIGERDDRLVAHDPVRPLPWVKWQGDGQNLLYLQDGGGNENYHLFPADLCGGDARDLTSGREPSRRAATD